MTDIPQWLPQLLSVDTAWKADTIDRLYDVFCDDIRGANLQYRGKNVWHFPEKEDGKEVLFWHLISRKPDSKIPRRKKKHILKGTHLKDRQPDLKRSERLVWVKPLIANPDCSDVLSWDYEEGDGSIKTYVWLKAHAFVVIMKKYSNGKRRLITSFYVDKPYKRKDFERKYAKRLA